jgi:ubiquitin C-terminal hydrolase
VIVKIFLSKELEFKYMKLKSSETVTVAVPKSTTNGNSSTMTEGLNLLNCIDAFVKKEKLEKGNEWYCNNCKEHVLATK